MAAQHETPAGSMLGETLLQQITRTFYDLLPAFERHMGVSRARWQVLWLLLREGGASQAVLTQRLHVDAAAISRQVKQLEEEGLVTRRADPQDNRFTLVALTPAGRQLADGLRDRREAFEALATEGISAEDIAAMTRCLARIRANVAAMQRPS